MYEAHGQNEDKFDHYEIRPTYIMSVQDGQGITAREIFDPEPDRALFTADFRRRRQRRSRRRVGTRSA